MSQYEEYRRQQGWTERAYQGERADKVLRQRYPAYTHVPTGGDARPQSVRHAGPNHRPVQTDTGVFGQDNPEVQRAIKEDIRRGTFNTNGSAPWDRAAIVAEGLKQNVFGISSRGLLDGDKGVYS